ncbi:MAG TPA: hypothetical protein VHZ50_11315 [Puia sp.]|nr:hypothetical protein [Puia sp.]
MKLEKRSAPDIPSEMMECRAYWEWAQNIPVLRDYLYKIVNEGKRSPILGRQLKNIGLRRGIPDYHFPVANDKWNGFWLEMKTRNKRTSSLPDHQEEWVEKLIRIDHYATFAYGWEDAADKTMAYIKNKV